MMYFRLYWTHEDPLWLLLVITLVWYAVQLCVVAFVVWILSQ